MRFSIVCLLLAGLVSPCALAAPPMNLEQALAVLKGKDLLIMEQAVDVLVAQGAAAVPHLLPLLGAGTERDARASAIAALGRIRDPRAVAPMMELLRELSPIPTDEDSFARQYLRTEAIVALGALEDPTATDMLERAAAGPDPFDRVHALTALVRVGQEGAWERLLATLRPGHPPEIRSLAVRGLALIGGEKAVVPLIQALSDAEWYVRDGAAETLGRLRDRQAVEELRRVSLEDSSAFVQRTAKEALLRLGEKR